MVWRMIAEWDKLRHPIDAGSTSLRPGPARSGAVLAARSFAENLILKNRSSNVGQTQEIAIKYVATVHGMNSNPSDFTTST